jgi:hypothetical protein
MGKCDAAYTRGPNRTVISLTLAAHPHESAPANSREPSIAGASQTPLVCLAAMNFRTVLTDEAI